MSCQACEQAQESDGVAYYRLGNANLAVQGCNEHLAEAFRRLNLHDELVVMVEELRGFACLLHEKPLKSVGDAITRANDLLAKAQS